MNVTEFFQDGPELGNPYDDDAVLRSYLKRTLPASLLSEVEPELRRMGERAITDIWELGLQAEREIPRHVPYDPWGRRIDHIEVSEAWTKLDRISAEEKLVAIAYERRQGEFSRVYQFAKVYLFAPSSAVYTCPLAMADGAARAIELYGDEALKGDAFRHLISSDPDEFWTSGQWMTEREGGSDVSGTSTLAKFENGQYRLYGTKWFTSATTSQMAMTLARIEGAPEGSRGLSLFYVELRNKDGSLQNIRIHRLKDKLGTRALPTAELTLEGTPAVLVGGEGNGVKKIASLFNITRIWNATCAVAFMRRGLALAHDYAKRRKAFGHRLADLPLHQETLASLDAEFQGAFHFMFRVAELLGKEETGKASSEESALLRLLTPILKLYTAKQGIWIASEVLECFGGAGYMEDTGIPKLLREAQVLAIWEGTTNVLSLDMLRALLKEAAFEPWLKDVEAHLSQARSPELKEAVLATREAAAKIKRFLASPRENATRSLSFGMARVYEACLLIAHAEWSKQFDVAKRWCSQDLAPFHEGSLFKGVGA